MRTAECQLLKIQELSDKFFSQQARLAVSLGDEFGVTARPVGNWKPVIEVVATVNSKNIAVASH